MAIAAVPGYLQKKNLDTASPALRFGMYLSAWEDSNNWKLDGSNKQTVLDSAGKLEQSDRKLMNQFNKRQQAVFDGLPNNGAKHRLIAQSTAPFTTGLGNEHPLENGFAFLNPYGLPYLPGSGVKGVVRRAAEELIAPGIRWEDESEWTAKASDIDILDTLDILFGSSENGRRGALSFWDVMPAINGDKLMVEIMTPHYSHYYQQKEHEGSTSPHDSGQPNPICFLTVPHDSGFTFHVTCDHRFLPSDADHPANHWRELLIAAFEHAFEWCGFGAKTAVGYGAMERDTNKEKEAEHRREEQEQTEKAAKERQEQFAKMAPVERKIQEVIDAKADKGMLDTLAIYQAVEGGRWSDQDKVGVARWLKTKMQEEKTWREKPKGKNPKKDKNYKRILKIKSWLEDQ